MLFSRLSKIIRNASHNNRNRAAFQALCTLGFSATQARRMLITGNNIRVNKLAQKAPVTAPTIYAAAYGKRNNPDGQAVLAEALDMKVHELFPDAHG